jgi:hypothetical protein
LATTSPLQVLPVPQGSDAPDGPTQITNLAKAVEQKVVMTFASAAARTSAFSAAGVSPAAGMVCYRSDAPGLQRHEYYNATSGSWRVFGPYRDAITLGSATASVTFSSIPTYLRRIEVSFTARGDVVSLFTQVALRVGADAGAFYSHNFGLVQNTSNGTPQAATGATQASAGYVPGSTTAAGIFSAYAIDIVGWDSPHSGCLAYRSQGGYAVGATNSITSHHSGNYVGSAAYTSITLFPSTNNFVAGSSFHLLGYE